MQDQFIFTFIPPSLNKPVHGLPDTGRPIRINRIVAMTESPVTRKLFGPDTGNFVTTAFALRYTLTFLPLVALPAWLRDDWVVFDPPMEVIPI